MTVTASVSHVYTLHNLSAANPTIEVTDTPAAGDVLILLTGQNILATGISAISGCGATWTRITTATNGEILDAWIGVGATSSGTVTVTAPAQPRAIKLFMCSGVSSTVVGGNNAVGTGTRVTALQGVGPGQLVFGYSFSDSAALSITGQTPATGWTESSASMSGDSRYMGTIYRAPTTFESHNFSAARSSSSTYVSQFVLGDPPAHRTNLLANPSFETNATGWSSGSRSNANPVAVAGSWYIIAASSTTDMMPATAGLDYSASAWVARTGTAARSASVTVHFYDAANAEISAPTVTNTTLVTQNVVERRWTTRTAPAGTTQVAVRVQGNSTISIDAVLLEQSSTVGDYFDGDTADTAGLDYGWVGVPHASQSIEIAEGAGNTISSSLTGSGTLVSSLVYQKRIASGLSGSGALTTVFHRYISSMLSGSGTLTALLSGRVFSTGFSGSGTLNTELVVLKQSILSGAGTLSSSLTDYQSIVSALSGTGTLSTIVAGPDTITSFFSGQGFLVSELTLSPRFTSNLSGEGFLFSELGYTVLPPELGTTPLGKLVDYSVGTSAVPLNPAEGSGSTPSVSATYLKGLHPELALGERNAVKAGNIGTYEGEIVNLSMDKASSNVRVSMSTPLSLLNVELPLFPFIDTAESTWTAVRAIDYWTQQCGFFYDKVPGEVIAYASAYGHNNAYAAGTSSHFYERLTGGAVATTVVNERSVKTFGFNVTSTTAFHEDTEASVPLTLLNHKKLLFSIGLGIRGTGRTAMVSWNFLDARDVAHVLSISATSAGLITAKIDGVVVDSTTVAGDANYRVTGSLETLGSAQLCKLTVHTDDLAGNGTEVFSGTTHVLAVALPSALRLQQVTHVSSGGSGSLMLRWGTYLTMDTKHPESIPAVQKSLAESTKPRLFVSGFEDNVWNMLNEFCAIARLDIRFLGERLSVAPRVKTLTAPEGNFSEFQYTSERRDKYKQVAVLNLQSTADTTDTALLWRADSVYQVAAREVFETTVQTDHSILNLVQPVAVAGIEPFPYVAGGGQYVVTGADGYIISPEWWNSNGGKVEVSLTGKAGEIAIKITAPTLDTVRAPYRISEGEADRPALYISGSGILNKPKEVHVGTGAKNAKEGFDSLFESPFISGVVETYDTAMAMASEYSAHNAEVDFEIPNDFGKPSRFGQFPAGLIFTDNVRNYRIASVSQTGSKVSGAAVSHTTIGAYVDSFPEGATLADAKARHAGKTIKQFNITPLRGTSV